MKTTYTALCLIFLMALSSCSLNHVENGGKLKLKKYTKTAKKLVKKIETKELASIEKKAKKLVELSKPILRKFSQGHPECSEYLNATLQASDQMLTMSLDTIERDYHSDGALPKASIKCYHAKDLLVHPATVIVLSRQEDSMQIRAEMKAELLEVLEHMKDVKRHLEGQF